jgi:hypothetical protein
MSLLNIPVFAVFLLFALPSLEFLRQHEISVADAPAFWPLVVLVLVCLGAWTLANLIVSAVVGGVRWLNFI